MDEIKAKALDTATKTEFHGDVRVLIENAKLIEQFIRNK